MKDFTMSAGELSKVLIAAGMTLNVYEAVEKLNGLKNKYGSGDVAYDEDIENMEITYNDFQTIAIMLSAVDKLSMPISVASKTEIMGEAVII